MQFKKLFSLKHTKMVLNNAVFEKVYFVRHE